MFDSALDLNQIFNIQNIIIYFIIINIITFFAMWLDKRKAIKGQWRTSETTLLTLVLLGGGIGGIAGMYLFKHKTKKLRFSVGFPAILIFEIVVIIYLIISFSK